MGRWRWRPGRFWRLALYCDRRSRGGGGRICAFAVLSYRWADDSDYTSWRGWHAWRYWIWRWHCRHGHLGYRRRCNTNRERRTARKWFRWRRRDSFWRESG